LNDLPAELINNIGKYLPNDTLAQLAATNKRLRFSLSETLKERQPAQLLEYVLKPTQENVRKAKLMIAAHPELMFIETTGIEWASGVEETVDEAGVPHHRAVPRIVKSSPFQGALGAGDKELYEYMAEHFDKVVYKNENGEIIETGIQRAQKQMQEQFPNGFEYQKVEKEFTDLMTEVVNAIATDQTLIDHNTPSEATQAVLKQFRNYLLPKDVTQGHHFNLNYLIEAFNLYNQNWDLWNSNQLSLFWRQVIGYLERLVPAVGAQAFCQGLYYYVEQNQPPTRSLKVYSYLTSTDIEYFSSSDVSAAAGLGFDFGIYTGAITVAGVWGRACGGVLSTLLKNYVEQKQQSLTTLNNTLNSGLSRAPENHSTWCAIL
jgi:hypothetical protein